MSSTGTNYGGLRLRTFPMTMNEQLISNYLATIMNAVETILNGNAPLETFEELYICAYTLTLHTFGERVYMPVKDRMEKEAQTKVRDEVLAILNTGDFLRRFIKIWTSYQASITMIRDILMYVEKVYVPQNNVTGIRNLGLIAFRDKVLRVPEIRGKFLAQVCETISAGTDPELVKASHKMLKTLALGNPNCFNDDFGKAFMNSLIQGQV